MAQLMPRPLTVSCFGKIQIGFTFLVLAHPGSPGKRVCVSKTIKRRGFYSRTTLLPWSNPKTVPCISTYSHKNAQLGAKKTSWYTHLHYGLSIQQEYKSTHYKLQFNTIKQNITSLNISSITRYLKIHRKMMVWQSAATITKQCHVNHYTITL